MWEEVRVGRHGQPVRVLASSTGTRDRITFDRLTDAQVQFWHGVLASRGTCYHETRLLREECERRRISTNPADPPGRRTLF